MATSSSKSTSAATATAALLLLMVTVLACGAEAQTINNTCNRTITITSPAGGSVTISPNSSITLTTPSLEFFSSVTSAVGVTIPSGTGSVSYTIPTSITSLLQVLAPFVSIVISCQGNCVTFTAVTTVPLLGQIFVNLGQACPPVVT